MAISQPRSRPDSLIRSPEGYPIAVVEIKNQQNLTRDVATKLRRNLVAHGLFSQIPYFLLTSQDVGFLWKETKFVSYDTPPTYEFPMDKVINRYLKRESGRRLYGAELELVVLQWLTDLTQETQKNAEEPEKTLALSGFSESIKGAMVLADFLGMVLLGLNSFGIANNALWVSNARLGSHICNDSNRDVDRIDEKGPQESERANLNPKARTIVISTAQSNERTVLVIEMKIAGERPGDGSPT